MNVREWMRAARARLTAAGDMDADADADWLLCDVLQLTRGALRLAETHTLSEEAQRALEEMLKRRESGEPLQYIEGFAWFWGMKFSVDTRVLIPRADTEILCEAALREIGRTAGRSVLDLCTGSGALAIAVQKSRPDLQVTASDISADALTVARENADALGAAVELVQSDLFTALADRQFDVILSNPPYLSDADMAALQTEVRREPALALRAGPDGLDVYRRIAAALRAHLAPGGTALFEVGAGQAQAVTAMMGAALMSENTEIITDLGGIDRVSIIRSV